VVSLAQYALTEARGQQTATDQTVELDRLRQQLALKDEELRIKDARMGLVPPQRRPHYPPAERLAILELRAARNWTGRQSAEAFLVSEDTIRAWMKRLDEQGPKALLQTSLPVNKFPEFVGYAVKQLKALCPTMGKKKIAETLARAGLHLATTTVGRILKQNPEPSKPEGRAGGVSPRSSEPATRKVTARKPNDIWHVDLTVVPIGGGFWVPWLPFSLPQCWPFCFWVAVILDNYSRRVMGTDVFYGQPTSEKVRAFLGRTISNVGSAPEYLICDRGVQFDNDGFRRYCKKKGIKIRYGAVGKHGSIAIIERFILTLKTCLALLPLIPLCKRKFQREISLITDWYNSSRPHTTLNAATPDEKYFGHFPACRKPRYEPRARWPRGEGKGGRKRGQGKEKGTFYFFRGRPRGRSDDSRPRWFAVRSVHRSSPKGVPRAMLRRTDSSSPFVCAKLTRASQLRGQGIGQSESIVGRWPPTRQPRLDQAQFSALRTRRARSGLRSTYRSTVSRWSSCWIGKALNLPCQTWPLPW